MWSDKAIIRGMQQEHDRLIGVGREVEAENARLQERVEEFETEPCPRRACVHTEVRADEAEAHMVEAWQEYRRLWLRWFEQRVEYRYAKKRERDRYKALAERLVEEYGSWVDAKGQRHCNGLHIGHGFCKLLAASPDGEKE